MTSESVDYPDYANLVAEKLLNIKNNDEAIGVLICGSGQGVAMRANKFKHIRAALCWNKEIAELSREHNNANVLCMGARFVDLKIAEEILIAFIQTKFAGGRHERRVNKLSENC
jgi:ribose 5-phosphate isomerase B